MHGTTRELNFGVISFVSIVFVLLVVIIVAGSTAWFRYEYRARQAKAIADDPNRGANVELMELNAEQAATLEAADIDEAMDKVAQRY